MPIESDRAGLRAGKPEVLLQTPAAEVNPAFSADGKWLAYAAAASGNFQVFVRAVPDRGGKWQISTGGGTYPVWSRAGHEVFFQAPDGKRIVALIDETKARGAHEVQNQVVFVENFFDELRRKVPVGK